MLCKIVYEDGSSTDENMNIGVNCDGYLIYPESPGMFYEGDKFVPKIAGCLIPNYGYGNLTPVSIPFTQSGKIITESMLATEIQNVFSKRTGGTLMLIDHFGDKEHWSDLVANLIVCDLDLAPSVNSLMNNRSQLRSVVLSMMSL